MPVYLCGLGRYRQWLDSEFSLSNTELLNKCGALPRFAHDCIIWVEVGGVRAKRKMLKYHSQNLARALSSDLIRFA